MLALIYSQCTRNWGVSIQLKPPNWQHFHIALFLQHFTKWHLEFLASFDLISQYIWKQKGWGSHKDFLQFLTSCFWANTCCSILAYFCSIKHFSSAN